MDESESTLDPDRPQQMLYIDKAAVDAILIEQRAAHSAELQIWRRLAIIVCAGLFVASAVIGYGVLTLVNVSGQRDEEIDALAEQAEDLDRQQHQILSILSILEGRAQIFEGMIITVDCNTRFAIQDLIEQLEALAGELNGITVITPECIGDP